MVELLVWCPKAVLGGDTSKILGWLWDMPFSYRLRAVVKGGGGGEGRELFQQLSFKRENT